MWRKQDEPKAPSPSVQKSATPTTNAPESPAASRIAPATAVPLSSPPAGHLTRLLVVKGEITGREDLFIDGEVHGKIRLDGAKLTIGPDGRVTADVEAREVVVRGEFKGNMKGQDRVQIAASGRATGEVSARLISIEEGAEVHLKVNLEKQESTRPQVPPAIISKPENSAPVLAAETVSGVSL
jgi:cytoskeletal protein CcmA (bactofilin family)